VLFLLLSCLQDLQQILDVAKHAATVVEEANKLETAFTRAITG
jgi:hypothetical protein